MAPIVQALLNAGADGIWVPNGSNATIPDVSPTGNTATFDNPGQATATTGFLEGLTGAGQAIVFDGSEEADANGYSITLGRTLIWFGKPPSSGNSEELFYLGDPSADGFGILGNGLSGGSARFYAEPNGDGGTTNYTVAPATIICLAAVIGLTGNLQFFAGPVGGAITLIGAITNNPVVTASNQLQFGGDTMGDYWNGTFALGATLPSVQTLSQIQHFSDLASVIPTQLGFIQQPSNANVAAVISPAVTVAIQDAGGATVTESAASVTIAKASGPGTLSGTLARSAASGIATFNDLQLSAAGTYTLSVTSSGLTGATSNSFTISTPSTGSPQGSLNLSAQMRIGL